MKLTHSALALVLSVFGTSALSGCDLQRLAADQTAEIADRGSLGFNGFWDYDIFGKAVPSAILQSEALIRISPDNEKMRTGLARTYVVYAYGWLSDEWETADQRGDFERADELEKRIMLLYKRATAHGLHVVKRHADEHFEALLNARIELIGQASSDPNTSGPTGSYVLLMGHYRL